MKLTISLRSSRRDGQKTYMERPIWSLDKGVMPPGRLLCCRQFRLSKVPIGVRTSGKPEKIRSDARGYPHIGRSDKGRKFRRRSELPAYLIKNPVRIWPFGFRSELFQTRGKLRK